MTKINKDLIVLTNPKSVISESIRTLRTNVQFSLMDKNKNVLMITSSMPAEGKSFLASNLSAAFAMANTKVLLIDCDLRKGRHNKVFKIDDCDGLSNLLLDDVNEYRKYIKKTETKNLDILFKGTTPPNPSELLGSEKCSKLMKHLRKEYDLIILDCAPLNYVTDALVLTSLADQALLVCSYKKTPMELLKASKKALENSNVKIAGVVMNNMEQNKKHYYNYRYSKYYE